MSITFPGVAGSNISTPDVNLLDGDTAHLVQGDPYTNLVRCTTTQTVPPSSFGSLTVTVTDAGADISARVNVLATSIPVNDTDTYTMSMDVENLAAVDRTFRTVFRTASGNKTGSNTVIAAGATVRIFRTGIVDPGDTAVLGIWTAEMRVSGGATIGDEYVISKICFREGTDTSFTPSLRINGVLDEVADPDDMPIVFLADESPLTAGDAWQGFGVSYVRRDGFGGPVVASYTFDVFGLNPGDQIPDGTTDVGDAGRTWTFNGDLHVASEVVGLYPIEDFAFYLASSLPDGINVYGHAADIGKLPAVVLVPGNPSIAVVTQGGPTQTLAWGVEATLVVNRSQPKYGTREIFDMWRQVADAAVAYSEAVTILTLEEVGEVEWSGGSAIAGTMPLIITVQET